ncbi:hypothetical protein DPMN_155029 [Dreissena polymorpha]|uniref:Uncharacterized protein n=1 Tax=Dreissena polymorpha TaxID=45954 RepID=A0A9D4J7I3_DREPO|nr:hypothetical protein DPMN_155029 [Dreissena polymorpha]
MRSERKDCPGSKANITGYMWPSTNVFQLQSWQKWSRQMKNVPSPYTVLATQWFCKFESVADRIHLW